MNTNLYAQSGVDVDATNASVASLQEKIASTHSPAVLANIGGFGSLYDLHDIIRTYHHPVLVQTIDGVGTKLTVAKLMQDYTRIGRDVIAACAGDILAMGATPISCMDYIAHEQFDDHVMQQIMDGMIDECRKSGIALIGGETAEMPGTYTKGEHDLVCAMTGVVDKHHIIDGSAIQEGDVIIALEASGLHTNGYSLARMIAFAQQHLSPRQYSPFLQTTIGDALLTPHRNYTAPLTYAFRNHLPIRGIAHITGGGPVDNITRILPQGLAAHIDRAALRIPPIMTFLSTLGKVPFADMTRTWNLGLGMIVVVPASDASRIMNELQGQCAYPVWAVGMIGRGEQTVTVS